jgi:carboxypeptidase PM20D1
MFKRSLLVLFAAIVVLAAVVAFNTMQLESKQLKVAAVAGPAIDLDAASLKVARAIQLRTITSPDNAAQFAQLHALLEASYPAVHATLAREIVGGTSLLYRWEGSDPSLEPVMWMAHQDVVPVAPNTEKDWAAPPFGGVIKDGFIWGRGAWDNKGNLCAQLEAVEQLIAAGFKPRRTLYLAFGADEETGGDGAKAIAALLAERKVRLDYVLDEGLLVTEGMLKGLSQPAALIGVAEKGYATVKLTLSMAGGHASMPGPASAIGSMSAALARLETRQFKANLHGVAREMLETLAPEMNGLNRVLLSNIWLFKPLLEHELAKGGATNAMLRTTTALTMIHAGNKDNVLPGSVEASVNFRLLPGDTRESLLAHVRHTIDDEAIKISLAPGSEDPSPVSPSTSAAYKTLNKTVREVFPDALVAPGLMLGASDSRHVAALSANVFKFTPMRATAPDLARFHGTDERLGLKNFNEMIRFYHQLLKNS